jgi:hypothetical protein
MDKAENLEASPPEAMAQKPVRTLSTPLLRAAAGQAPAELMALLSGPVGEAIAKASGYASKALSENTRRAYATDFFFLLPSAGPAECRRCRRTRWWSPAISPAWRASSAAPGCAGASPPLRKCIAAPAIPGRQGTRRSAPPCAASWPATPNPPARRQP